MIFDQSLPKYDNDILSRIRVFPRKRNYAYGRQLSVEVLLLSQYTNAATEKNKHFFTFRRAFSTHKHTIMPAYVLSPLLRRAYTWIHAYVRRVCVCASEHMYTCSETCARKHTHSHTHAHTSTQRTHTLKHNQAHIENYYFQHFVLFKLFIAPGLHIYMH